MLPFNCSSLHFIIVSHRETHFGQQKRPLSQLNVKMAYCFHLVLRMHPGNLAHEILPLAQRLRKHTSFCTRNRGKQIHHHLFLSFLFFYVLWNYFIGILAIFAAHLGERTVRIREVRGFDPLQVHQTRRLSNPP